MRRAGVFLIAPLALAITPLGCSLLTSLDGLSGGVASDATTEGSAAETGTSDAPPVGDAPVVPGDAAEAGKVDPCAGATMCDDFERPDVQPARAALVHHSFDKVAHVRVAFSLKVGAADRQISLMRVQLNQSDRNEVFDLFMLPGKIVASEQGFGAANAGYFDYAVQSGFRPDVWQRWSLELDARGNTALGIVTLDGTEVIRASLHNAYTQSVLGVLMGAYYAPDGPPHDIFYDDVEITILP